MWCYCQGVICNGNTCLFFIKTTWYTVWIYLYFICWTSIKDRYWFTLNITPRYGNVCKTCLTIVAKKYQTFCLINCHCAIGASGVNGLNVNDIIVICVSLFVHHWNDWILSETLLPGIKKKQTTKQKKTLLLCACDINMRNNVFKFMSAH